MRGKKPPLHVDFDRGIKLELHGATVTSDGGLLAYRELDEALQLTDMAFEVLNDTRTGLSTQHHLQALVRQSVYSRLTGDEDVNDAKRLSKDPAMRMVIGDRAKKLKAASSSEMGRLETETLSTDGNLGALVVAHANYVTFQLAEVAVPRRLFAQILRRIARLTPPIAPG